MTPEQELAWIAEKQKTFSPAPAESEKVVELQPYMQTAVTLAEPGVRPKPTEQIAAPMPGEPGPLTEKETIEIVKQWVAEDAEFELSERRTFEEMVEALQDV